MRNLWLRIITSLVLLPLVIAAFLFGGVFLQLILSLVMILCAIETANMIAPKSVSTTLLSAALGLGLFLPFLLAKATLIIPAISIIIFVANAIFLFSPDLKEQHLEKMGAIFYFVFYVALALSALYWLRESAELKSNIGLSLIFIACAATWGNDTCAYFGGRFIGKHPLYMRVSAKKTWEGFFSGALGSVLLVAALFYFLMAPYAFFEGLEFKDCLFIVLPAMILAPLGDLIESRLKRLYNVKDSSQMLPGHGGILDRIDGLLTVLPWTAFYAFFIRPLW